MDANAGLYIPPELVHGQQIRASIDNIDAQVDTIDGKNSFHALVSAVYQKHIKDQEMAGSEKIPLKKISNNLKSGPATVINMNPCSITGNPKPTTSPQYNTFVVFDNKNILEEYYFIDLTWLFARYDGRSIVQQLM